MQGVGQRLNAVLRRRSVCVIDVHNRAVEMGFKNPGFRFYTHKN